MVGIDSFNVLNRCLTSYEPAMNRLKCTLPMLSHLTATNAAVLELRPPRLRASSVLPPQHASSVFEARALSKRCRQIHRRNLPFPPPDLPPPEPDIVSVPARFDAAPLGPPPRRLCSGRSSLLGLVARCLCPTRPPLPRPGCLDARCSPSLPQASRLP